MKEKEPFFVWYALVFDLLRIITGGILVACMLIFIVIGDLMEPPIWLLYITLSVFLVSMFCSFIFYSFSEATKRRLFDIVVEYVKKTKNTKDDRDEGYGLYGILVGISVFFSATALQTDMTVAVCMAFASAAMWYYNKYVIVDMQRFVRREV